MNDDLNSSLSRLLKCWQGHPPVKNADFCDCVWTRIRSQSQSAPRGTLFGFPSSLRAVACWVAALSAFGGSAAAFAYDSLTREERMAAAHARAIDPLQIIAAANTVHRH